MYCRICGEKIPDDSLFCPHCGREVISADAPAAPPEQKEATPQKIFAFPPNTTYDKAAEVVNNWLKDGNRRIDSASFTLDSTMLAGTVVPVVSEIAVAWTDEPNSKPYQLGMMMDTCTDFGLNKSKNKKKLTRQFDRWREEHPELEIAGLQQTQLSLGWSSAWVTCFFFR